MRRSDRLSDDVLQAAPEVHRYVVEVVSALALAWIRHPLRPELISSHLRVREFKRDWSAMPPDNPVPQPPQPPTVRRRVNLSRGQIVGLPLMLLLPLLALFGVFGVSEDTAVARGDTVEVRVDYSRRTRFMASHDLEIEVRNPGDGKISIVPADSRPVIDRHESGPV